MLKVVPTAAMSILNSSELLKKSFKSMLMIAASLLDFQVTRWGDDKVFHDSCYENFDTCLISRKLKLELHVSK